MKIFNKFIEKVRTNKKWFTSVMATLIVALFVVVILFISLPEVKANAIVDDPTGKTMTYNLSAIVDSYTGSGSVIEVLVNVTDPDYKYYIVGDGRTYNNVSIIVDYNLSVTKEVPIYLDNVKIVTNENVPILKFEPSTNDNTNTEGSYKVIVKGDCSMTSTCVGATYPVIQVESIGAQLYQLKSYNGEDYNNPANYYDMVSSSFNTKVEFTSYEFAEDEAKTECSLYVSTANKSYGAGIGTTAGTVDISAEGIVLSDGKGTPIDDLAEGQLMAIFNKPLRVGAQAIYNSYGITGDITISGALKLTVIGNGYGACIGGGGSYISDKAAKNAGKVNINGGTIYLDARDIIDEKGSRQVPAIGGGLNSANDTYGTKNDVVVSGGSIYIRDNGIQFGSVGAYPINTKGDELLLYEVDYVNDIDEDGKLVISSQRYEEKHKADITVVEGYVDISFEYNSRDYSATLPYDYEGFGHNQAELKNKLYFYIPASPLCSLEMDENSFLEEDIPQVSVQINGLDANIIDGKYWMASGADATVTLKGIPSYMDVKNIILTDVKSNVTTDYSTAFVFDETTGDYVVTVKIASDSKLSIVYDSDIKIDYDYGFLEGDDHKVSNLCPTEYDLGAELVISDSDVVAEDIEFAGWYSVLTGDRITNINSSNLHSVMDANGIIKLKAKWNIKVSYDFGEGTGDEIEEFKLPYGEEANIVISGVVPELPYHIFEGWNINGLVCGGGYVYTTTPTDDIVISASYLQSNFFVYIDASPKKFNAENVDIYVGLKGNAVTAENNLLLKEPNGAYRTKEIDGVTYYMAVVENEASLAIILTQKPGHIISGQNVTVTQGSGGQIVMGTTGSEDGEMSIQLTIDEDDVYISTESEFVLREYDISFYDGMSESGGEKLWEESEFVYTIEDLEKPIGDILGDKASEITKIGGRFYEFIGWLDKLTGKVYTNEDALLENLGDVILVAQWNEIPKYEINVTVIDEVNGQVSDDVFAIPYYMNEDGSIEEIYTEKVLNEETSVLETIAYAKEDDKVVIKFFYYDNNGDKKDVTNGVILRGMELNYTKSTGSATTEEIAAGVDCFVCPQPMKDTPVNAIATIGIEEYTIVYWDTRGVEHNNPTTYTFFDEIEFEEIYENVGWLLVTSDEDENNFDDIKTVPIEKVERGSIGNLVLKADWTDYVETTYKAQVDSHVENGVIEIVYPVDRNSFIPNETLVIKVTPDTGYKLKGDVISYIEMRPVSISTNMVSTFGLQRDTVMYNAVEITGSDGIYLVNMPERDIVITASFEIAKYSITYNEVDGLKNSNVDTFTYFDTIELLPVEKEGYEFLGWKDVNGNVINTISNMSSDIVLVPEFKAISAEVPEEEGNDETVGKDEDESAGKNDDSVNNDVDKSDTDNDDTGNNNEDKNDTGKNDVNKDGADKNDTGKTDTQAGETVNGTDNSANDSSGSKVTITDKNNNSSSSVLSEEETTKPHIIGGGNAYGSSAYTGDTSNVARLILISVGAVLVLMIVVLAKGNKLGVNSEE